MKQQIIYLYDKKSIYTLKCKIFPPYSLLIRDPPNWLNYLIVQLRSVGCGS